MRTVVFDIETSNTFYDVGNDPTRLDISVVVAYDYETDRYYDYVQQDLPELWKLLEQTDAIVGYNSDHFDIPILNKYYPGDLTQLQSIDLMKAIKKFLGKRIRLDMVAEGTLGKKKSGSGLDAIKWWREGNVEKVIRYCRDDVQITKELYDYALQNGRLKYALAGKTYDVPIDTAAWAKENTQRLNQTLPL